MNNARYDKWKKLYQDQKFLDFNTDEALLWLKVKAISKKTPMTKFLENNGIKLESTCIKDQNIELFTILEGNPKRSLVLLDAYLCDVNNEWYRQKGVNEQQLKSDLYRVDSYEWGGDQNNSLDKYLIGHYVKDISIYDELKQATGYSRKRLELCPYQLVQQLDLFLDRIHFQAPPKSHFSCWRDQKCGFLS